MRKREEFEQMTEVELFDEIIDAVQGDMWDGMRSKTLIKEERLMKQVFAEKMRKAGIKWD